jgi:teichuronic acid exporter
MEKASENFSAGIRSGAIWSYGSQVFLTVLSFLVGVVMARLLGPADFGVFMAVTSFTSIVMLLVQFGIPPALIQAKELDARQKDASLGLMLLFAIVLSILLFVVAGPLSAIYESDDFAPVMYAMALLFLPTTYPAIGLALLRREMRFPEVARINALAQLWSSISSIAAAMLGFGVYSLVLGAVIGTFTTAIGTACALRWWPAWPRLLSVRPLLRYASLTTVNIVQDMAINRADNMLVGAVLGTSALGLYNRAFSLARLPSDQFAESLGPLLLGALSRVQTDLAWSRLLFLKAISAISIVTMPFLALLFFAGPQLVRLIYGEAWADAGDPLQVMVAGGYFVMLSALLQRFAYAQNLVSAAARVHFLVLVATILLVSIAAPFGLTAIAWAIVLREVLWTTLLARVVSRSSVALGFWTYIHASTPSLIAACVSGVAALCLVDLPPMMEATALSIAFVKFSSVLFLVYFQVLLVLVFLWRTHEPLAHTAALFVEILHRSLNWIMLKRKPS